MRLDREALAWIPAGAAAGVAFLGILSIGLFILPFAVGLAAYDELGLFGVACFAAGVLACVVSHRGATRTR